MTIDRYKRNIVVVAVLDCERAVCGIYEMTASSVSLFQLNPPPPPSLLSLPHLPPFFPIPKKPQRTKQT